ncbi:MAG TPA: inositol monophosphatase family protein [Solirubrobacteraceae bacterium]|nr:inositol monophosphatase family protein [Solirubrobacteraceae bacterium]
MTAAGPDWLGAARAAADELRAILAAAPTTVERARETGTRGKGGDRTLEIDAAAEAAVFRQLERLHAEGARFAALSEERGTVDFGADGPLVVIDPIDGSKNAKRGLPNHALSLAVAEGPTMADVVFGYVRDFGPEEEWVARRGEGATLNGVPVDPEVAERKVGEKLEIIGFESADPRWVRASADALAEVAYRVRAIGTIAVSLCQVAAVRFDGMVTLRGCRAVDAAAAQLIVREAGGHVAFIAFEDPLGAPLDLAPHSPVVAARTPESLRALARVPTM